MLIMAPGGQLISGSSDFTISNTNIEIFSSSRFFNLLFKYHPEFWDLQQESCIHTLTGHRGAVNALAITNSGELASGSNDKSIVSRNARVNSLDLLKSDI